MWENSSSASIADGKLQFNKGGCDDEFVDEKLRRHLYYMQMTILTKRQEGNLSSAVTMDREDRIKNLMCRELQTVGHKAIMDKMERGDIPVGRLLSWGNVLVKVGPVFDFIMPDTSLEILMCVNQKAIRLLQRWRTADDFVDGWNEFFGDHSDSSINRTIVLLDAVYHRFEHGYEDNYKVMYKIVQLNRETLIEMWSRAAERVEALLRIDFLKVIFRVR